MGGFSRIASLLSLCATARAAFELGYKSDDDLTHFVTRPEIKAPLFNVTIHKPEQVTPGYFFVAPYASINQQSQANRYYQTCQTGPAIYDGSGELVWSGACLFKNQNACDFRPYSVNGVDYLSTIVYGWTQLDNKGRAAILDSSYEVLNNIITPRIEDRMNMHEFNVLPGGRTALYVTHRPTYVDLAELEEFGITKDAGWVLDCGFREVELETNRTVFEWWAQDHGVKISTSSVEIQNLEGPPPSGWNYLHMNSVDKNEDGDYLISSRYTDCIYKISGIDGSVIWRLGGDESDFILDGFNFSKQHDARFIDQSEGRTVITLLDNASDGINRTSNISSGLLLELDTMSSPKVAKVLRRWERPDGKISHLRGNFQMLPNRNMFGGWSDHSVISEHTFDGEVVMTASFQSDRFVTYRSWKHNFTGRPSEPPVMKTYAFGVTAESSTTVGYLSWNGATEVSSWSIFSNSSRSAPIASVSKDGFETMFQVEGFQEALYAEALSATGEVLGETVAIKTEVPSTWTRRVESIKKPIEGSAIEGLGIMDEKSLFGLGFDI